MKQSNFRFSQPVITDILFKFNPDCSEVDSLKNEFKINVMRDETKNEAVVELQISIGEEDLKESIPFFVVLTICANFSWDNVYDEEILQDLLSKNAPALLLSYARPIVATITANSPCPSYNIPFYNFNDE